MISVRVASATSQRKAANGSGRNEQTFHWTSSKAARPTAALSTRKAVPILGIGPNSG
jgi:hypothetical protein